MKLHQGHIAEEAALYKKSRDFLFLCEETSQQNNFTIIQTNVDEEALKQSENLTFLLFLLLMKS